MNIVHVISSITPGGAEIFVKELSLEQRKTDKVSVIVLSKIQENDFTNKYISELKINNILLYFIEKKPKVNRMKAIYKLRKYIKLLNPDIINTHLEHVSFYVATATLGFRSTMIQTVHSSKIHYPMMHRMFFLKRFKQYIAVSNNVRESLVIQNIPGRIISVVPNGIGINKFQRKSSVSNKARNLISVGRLHIDKNQLLLLKAIKILRDEKITLNLMVIGEGDYYDKLEQYVEMNNLQNQISFLGKRSDIPQLLLKNDIFISTSRVEGLPITLIEAIVTGLPMVVSDIPAHREIIGNNNLGLLFKSDSVKDLVCKIKMMINNYELRCRFYQKCIENTQNYDIKICAERTRLVYEKFWEK